MDVAALLRELGHEFVDRTLSDDQLDALASQLPSLIAAVRSGTTVTRTFSSEGFTSFSSLIPEGRPSEPHQLFTNSIVSGGGNPMGQNAELWREGDVAVMEVTLGRAFEGAPGRAHGGAVAALLDETMGVVHIINEALAYTAQLNITFLAPTPIGEPIVARAWLARREGRKLFIEASLRSGERDLASATALFIAVDPATFRTPASESD
jgi:acyl-coenzyme A thioesterase PaaI-like protein